MIEERISKIFFLSDVDYGGMLGIVLREPGAQIVEKYIYKVFAEENGILDAFKSRS